MAQSLHLFRAPSPPSLPVENLVNLLSFARETSCLGNRVQISGHHHWLWFPRSCDHNMFGFTP